MQNPFAAKSPLDWPWARSSPPLLSSEQTPWRGALLRRWRGTSAEMVQPPLDHHYIVVHLGGAKRVTRRRDGPLVEGIAEPGSITVVPAGTAYVWRTHGPIAFAHLYVEPQRLGTIFEEELDADPRGIGPVERVACRDPLLEPLLGRMLAEIEAGMDASPLLLDSLLAGVLLRLARQHRSCAPRRAVAALALAPHRLRRVLEFIEAHLGNEIALADLARESGAGASHFSHAFHAATGESPYRYVTQRRVEYAQVLLLASDEPIHAVGAMCGFNSRHQFAVTFKHHVGLSPRQFRQRSHSCE
ncbi:MAG: AraC family transcriptional regulator [Caldimonas sp.]